jgi:hypothetical protein
MADRTAAFGMYQGDEEREFGGDNAVKNFGENPGKTGVSFRA